MIHGCSATLQGLYSPTSLSLARSKPWEKTRREATARFRVRRLQRRFDGLLGTLAGPGDFRGVLRTVGSPLSGNNFR
jgi:hypothetical protein